MEWSERARLWLVIDMIDNLRHRPILLGPGKRDKMLQYFHNYWSRPRVIGPIGGASLGDCPPAPA